MKLSIVIPSYCADKHLESCLSAVALQDDKDTEVIIVDCSPNDNVENICKKFNFVNFVKKQERFNPGEGRNIGAGLSSGEYLIFIDADVVLETNALKNIRKHIDAGYRIFGAALELNEKENNDFAAHVEHYYFNHEAQSTRAITKRRNLSSAFMIIEKSLFNEFSGFSDIPRMQDTELTERIGHSGIDIYFVPDVIGLQIQDSPLNKVLKKISITGNNIFYICYESRRNYLGRILLFCLLPLMALAKITRINIRNLKYSFSIKMLTVYAPFMYVCGMYWMLGFYRGIIKNDGIASGR